MSEDPSPSDAYDSKALTVDQAVERIVRAAQPVAGVERVGLREARARVLASAVHAPFDLPPHTSSAVDGYALRHDDVPVDETAELTVAGESFAGGPYDGAVHSGQCVRIMTGAVLPAGADTIVMQEHVTRAADRISVPPSTPSEGFIRRPGEDLIRGERVLEAGRRLNAADIGVLASLGWVEIEVRRRAVAAIFVTGDELRGVGETLGSGEIYDSNRYTLHGMLSKLGVRAIDMGVVRDAPADTVEALATAAAVADIVITSGGVSVGAADHVRGALDELGEVDFWRVAVKPGRPLAFGMLGDALFFGLPGNPVSAMITFALFVRPALQRLNGKPVRPLPSMPAVTRSHLRKAPGRSDYQRGVLSRDADGRASVTTTGPQGSHVLSSMSRANALIVLPQDSADVQAGSEVEVISLGGLL